MSLVKIKKIIKDKIISYVSRIQHQPFRCTITTCPNLVLVVHQYSKRVLSTAKQFIPRIIFTNQSYDWLSQYEDTILYGDALPDNTLPPVPLEQSGWGDDSDNIIPQTPIFNSSEKSFEDFLPTIYKKDQDKIPLLPKKSDYEKIMELCEKLHKLFLEDYAKFCKILPSLDRNQKTHFEYHIEKYGNLFDALVKAKEFYGREVKLNIKKLKSDIEATESRMKLLQIQKTFVPLQLFELLDEQNELLEKALEQLSENKKKKDMQDPNNPSVIIQRAINYIKRDNGNRKKFCQMFHGICVPHSLKMIVPNVILETHVILINPVSTPVILTNPVSTPVILTSQSNVTLNPASISVPIQTKPVSISVSNQTKLAPKLSIFNIKKLAL